MDDILMRDQAPLSSEEWNLIDHTIVEVGRKVLVGRRFLNLFGPLGLGAQFITLDRIAVEPGTPVGVDLSTRRIIPLTTLQQDFILLWQDIAAARQANLNLDMGPIAAATVAIATAEDNLIFHGSPQMEGLLTVEGHQGAPMGDWDNALAAIGAVASAVGMLMNAGIPGPYALAVNPINYAKLLTPVNGMQLALTLVQQVATAGVFQTTAISTNQAIVVAAGRENLELVLGQDLTTAYIGPEGLDHRFRLVETLALRIRRPKAIVVLGA